jgi:cytochrome P450
VPGGQAAFWTAPHGLHRIRREVLNNYFSPAKVAAMQPLLQEKIARLCQRFDEYEAQKAVANLSDGFNAVATEYVRTEVPV